MKRLRVTTDFIDAKLKRLRITDEDTLGERNRQDDRISSLPDHILHRITSSLQTIDAVKTSVLSKAWTSVWRSSPVLNFNQFSFARSRNDSKREVFLDFCRYVDWTILSRRGETSLEKFELVVDCTVYRQHRRLDRWLNYAIDNVVKHLVFAYHGTTSDDSKTRQSDEFPESDCLVNTSKSKSIPPYELPQSLYQTQTLKTLDLFGCFFVKPQPGIDISFSLTKLKLSTVKIDNETLQSLVSNSNLIEELCMESCAGFQFVKITSPKLHTVDLNLDREKVQIVAVSAPNLKALSYAGGSEAVEGSLAASEHYNDVRELRLHDVDIRDDFFRVLSDFPRLTKLELKTCCMLERIRIHGDRIKELSISQCPRLKMVELGTCNLSSFWCDDDGCEIMRTCGEMEDAMSKLGLSDW